MKKGILTLIALIGMLSTHANAQATDTSAGQSTTRTDVDAYNNLEKSGDVGVGFKWGTLTGLSGKYWMDEVRALDGTVAFKDNNVAAGLHYITNLRTVVSDYFGYGIPEQFVPYIGVGAIAAFGSNTEFFNRNTENFGMAAQIPIGLEFLPRSLPVGIFAEFSPSFGFIPTTYTFLTADIGARYYF